MFDYLQLPLAEVGPVQDLDVALQFVHFEAAEIEDIEDRTKVIWIELNGPVVVRDHQ